MGTHMIVNFYLSPLIDPKDYGFVEREDCWYLKFGHQNSAVFVDKVTRRIRCNGVSSKCLATLFRIAAKGGIEIEDPEDTPRQYRINVTEAEMRAIEAMRGHPKEEGE